MLLYCPYNTARLRYTVDFINKELFDAGLVITSDREIFQKDQGPKLNYSEEVICEDEFFLQSSGLLFETGIRAQEIECFELNFYKAFFQTRGDFPFDIFAAIFYLLSRYEEYLPHEPDEFGRYHHTNSLAYREGFLHLPMINFWLHDFRKALRDRFPDMVFRQSCFKFIPTYDIDIAYSYQHKGWKRNLGGLARSAVQGEWKQLRDRVSVLLGRQKDPYDAYEWLDSIHLYSRMRAYYFFLVAREQKGYDKNIPRDQTALKTLISYHSSGSTIGIHPSWQSGDDESVLEDEIHWLSRLTDTKVAYSRQHYLRFSLPHTYRQLIVRGIEKEFSMGYGGVNGFRASAASSFYWYDLQREEPTSLMLFPFCFMDSTCFYELGMTAQQALHELMNYYHVVKKVNGMMVTIWHNQFLGSDPLFSGWKDVYEIFLREEVYWDM